jgi:hypothetical protein
MLDEEKKLLLANAFQAGADEARQGITNYLNTRIGTHNHFMLEGRYCAICMSWEQVIGFIRAQAIPVLCDCRSCSQDIEKPCQTCSEACLPCQDKFDTE